MQFDFDRTPMISTAERRNLETLEVGRNLRLQDIVYSDNRLSTTLQLPIFAENYQFDNNQIDLVLTLKKISNEEIIHEQTIQVTTTETKEGIQMYLPQTIHIEVDLAQYIEDGLKLCISDQTMGYDYNIIFLDLNYLV